MVPATQRPSSVMDELLKLLTFKASLDVKGVFCAKPRKKEKVKNDSKIYLIKLVVG
jgi:hypothetical protein